MADIESGDPETSRADQHASLEWSAKRPSFTKLVETRAEREAKISKFKEEQKQQRNWVSLRAAIDWRAKLNERGERTAALNEALALKYLNEIWEALSGAADDCSVTFQLGAAHFPSCKIVNADQVDPVSDFSVSDLEELRKGQKSVDHLIMVRALIDRLWVPRTVLLSLFHEKQWLPVPSWLEQPSARALQEVALNAAGKSPEKAGRHGKRGAKQKIEWRQEIYPFMFQMLKEKGDFDERGQEEGWRAQADMERAVSEYIADTLEKDMAESTVREWVARFMPELRAELASAQGR
jgi:hypothetical protein